MAEIQYRVMVDYLGSNPQFTRDSVIPASEFPYEVEGLLANGSIVAIEPAPDSKPEPKPSVATFASDAPKPDDAPPAPSIPRP